MRELEVLGVRLEMPEKAPVVLLREKSGRRVLPIWIGAGEASAIIQAIEDECPARPLTHDLLADVLVALGPLELSGVITGVQEGVFLAQLRVGRSVLDARPSDLVALAVRTHVPLSCPAGLLDDVGIVLDEPEVDEVQRFKEFLDRISPDDFEPHRG